MEETIDPTVKLTKFLKEDKLAEAFNMALSADNVDLVAWLCNQVVLSRREMLGWNTWKFGCYGVTTFGFARIGFA